MLGMLGSQGRPCSEIMGNVLAALIAGPFKDYGHCSGSHYCSNIVDTGRQCASRTENLPYIDGLRASGPLGQ